jgi:REP element-mobilizing transposase RayT
MSYTNLKYHIVFSTKDRRPFLHADVKPRLVEYLGGILRQLKGVLVEANGPEDHIHLAAGLHPQTAVSDVLRELKCNSTRWVKSTFPDLGDFRWQDEYSAFTVSHSQLPGVIEYIRRQVEHHRRMTFQEELRLLLKKHEVDFDERFLLR